MPTRTILGLSLLAALVAAGPALAQTKPASGGSKKESPAQVLDKIDARLLAWDVAGARELLDKLPDAGNARAQVAAGRMLMQEGKFNEAAGKLAAAVAAAPGDPSPAVYLGEAHRLAERPEDARKAFETAAERASSGLKGSPDDVGMLVALGVARQNLRQLPEAIAALEKARKLAPGNVQAAYQLGVTHALARNFPQAVEQLTQAIDRNPEIAYAYYFRALSAEKVDRKDLLINDLQRFLALAPNAPDAPRAKRLLAAIRG